MITPMARHAPRAFLYVSCSKGAAIDTFTLDLRNGGLTHMSSVPLPADGMPLALSPNKRHLYAAIASAGETTGPQYITFRIDPSTGLLERQAIIAAPGRMSHITVDRSGHYLLGASVSSGLISSHTIEADGTLRAEPAVVRSVPGKAHQITTDISNQLAFVPNLGADLVMQLTFHDESGTFIDNEPAAVNQPESAAPRHMAHHPSGHYAYLLNEEAGTIAAFHIDHEHGTLSPFQTSSYLPEGFAGKPWGAQILVTPDGRFLYTSERTSGTIALHTIDLTSGRITRGATWQTEQCPRNFAIDPAGRYLIAAGETSNRIACYAIDQATGDLTLKSTHPTASGPVWIEALQFN